MPLAMEHFDLYKNMPDDWLGLDDRSILMKLKRPTIFHCQGHDSSQCVIVSGMLHGNEPSGFSAIIEELKRHARGVSRYRIDVIFLIGNVEAARAGSLFETRHLPSQPDMNRLWKSGTDITDEWEVFIKTRNPIAHLDLHNTTGQTQPFAIWTKEDQPTRRLANVLAGTHMYLPESMSSFIGFNAQFCPSICIECGKRMLGQSDEHARMTMQRFFLATQVVRGNPERYFFQKVFHNARPISIQDGVPFFLGAAPVPGSCIIRKDLDRFNFMEMKAGETLGWSPKNYLVIKKGQLPTDEFIDCVNGALIAKKPMTICLATPDEAVAKSDHLFYIIEEKV